MEIRDPVHGSIHVSKEFEPIIKHIFFQRLRNIKQLGFCEYVFPGATHSRFLHSIGVMSIAEKVFEKLFLKISNDKNKQDILRIKKTFELAALLHDIGHAPLSHSTESVMPTLEKLNISSRIVLKNANATRKATHEDYTVKIIADSSFKEAFKDIEEIFGVDRLNICSLISGENFDKNYFTIENVNYFPLLHQLISSEMDCDRMDYLIRDSYFCGVSYGNFDLDWLIDNLAPCVIDNNAFLGISERAIVTFDDFLLSRFHMFLMVYFHYKSVCLEQLLLKYFEKTKDEYIIPGDVEKYIEHDDYYLIKILKASKSPYAASIIKNEIPDKIYESFNDLQLKELSIIKKKLKEENVEFIHSSSTGRLSKYYRDIKVDSDKQYSIKVFRNGMQKNMFFDIDDATDLFQKFSKAHAVNRLHCDTKNLSKNLIKELKKLGAVI